MRGDDIMSGVIDLGDSKSQASKVGSVFGGLKAQQNKSLNLMRRGNLQAQAAAEEKDDKKLTHLSDFLRN